MALRGRYALDLNEGAFQRFGDGARVVVILDAQQPGRDQRLGYAHGIDLQPDRYPAGALAGAIGALAFSGG